MSPMEKLRHLLQVGTYVTEPHTGQQQCSRCFSPISEGHRPGCLYLRRFETLDEIEAHCRQPEAAEREACARAVEAVREAYGPESPAVEMALTEAAGAVRARGKP
jgi:hypothetical protein